MEVTEYVLILAGILNTVACVKSFDKQKAFMSSGFLGAIIVNVGWIAGSAEVLIV